MDIKERVQALNAVVDLLQTSTGNGLCYATSFVYGIKIHPDDWWSIVKYKPEEKEYAPWWFKLDKEGQVKRIRIVKNVIDELLLSQK